MYSSPLSAVLLTAFGLGCGGGNLSKDGSDSNDQSETGVTELDSGEAHQANGLDAFREMRQTHLNQSVAPTRLALDPTHGQGLILDTEAETVWGTDSLFLHDPRTVCINNDSVRDSSPPNTNGACPEGTMATARGKLHTDHPPTAIAIQAGGGMAGILDSAGGLSWVSTDPLGGSAQDHMRPLLGPSFDEFDPGVSHTLLAITSHEIAVAQDTNLWIYNHIGEILSRVETNDSILDIVHDESGWWTISATATTRNGERINDGGLSFLSADNGLWAVSGDTLTKLDDSEEMYAIEGATGPAVQWGERLLVATTEGISELTGADIELLWSGEVIDMQVNDAGELVVLDGGGSLRIYVDETSYPDDTTLHAWISTFIEKPRKREDTIPCRGEGETIQGILQQANANRGFLQDMPATTALGVTPSHWARAMECDEREALEAIVENLELGALFHEAPEECTGDLPCYEEVLAAEQAVFSVPPQWVSGLGAHTELGINWVEALHTIGAPDRFVFFGMSMRPDVPHASDIRAKNSWPSSLNHHSGSWRTDDVDGIIEAGESGWLTIMPGDNIPAFNLGACANLFVNECHPLGRGDGGELGDSDIASLDLLLHRALASAHGGGTHTWNFHLPDIGVYDYTDGCTVDEGQWAGDACEAARLQAWLQDVYQRFVLNGLLQWSTPGAMVLP
jgi:hypothetical protein